MGLGQLLFGFNGRIRRTNYWLGSLGAGFVGGFIYAILFMVLGGAALAAGAVSSDGQQPSDASVAAASGSIIALLALSFVFFVFMLWISLALQVKRWHDRDKSGVWVLVHFIPLVGWLWVLIECGFLDGTMGPNRYGPSPKGITGPPPMQPTGAYPPQYSQPQYPQPQYPQPQPPYPQAPYPPQPPR